MDYASGGHASDLKIENISNYPMQKYDCIENNPYYDDDENNPGLYRNDLRDLEKYFNGCSEFEFNDGDDRRRKSRRLHGNGDDDDISYYIGLYCADQGGKFILECLQYFTCSIHVA